MGTEYNFSIESKGEKTRRHTFFELSEWFTVENYGLIRTTHRKINKKRRKAPKVVSLQ